MGKKKRGGKGSKLRWLARRKLRKEQENQSVKELRESKQRRKDNQMAIGIFLFIVIVTIIYFLATGRSVP